MNQRCPRSVPRFIALVAWASLLAAGCSGTTGSGEPAAELGAPQSPGPMSPRGDAPIGAPGPNESNGSLPAQSPPTPDNAPPGTGMSGEMMAEANAPPTPPSGITTPRARPGIATRLSKVEYAHSIEDALGVVLAASLLDATRGGIPEDSGDGVFKRMGDSQTSVEQHASGYFEAASVVSESVNMAAFIATHASCDEPSVDCGRPVVAALGRRLFRRSLNEREVEQFTALLQTALEAEEDLGAALRWVLQALLQAPQFLFHLEAETEGTPESERELHGTELSARLASFIWVSLPDDELLALAESGELTDSAVLQGQVTRLLEDPRAQRLTAVFARDFSRAHLASFVGASDPMRDALHESIVATFQRHLWEMDRSIAELFTTTEFVVNQTVAELLGLSVSPGALQPVDVSALPERIGILTHPGMISGMGDRDIGSFVNRGKYLMERLLCRNPVAVPAALLTELEEFNQETTGLNEHERAALRMTRPECWGCHAQFEPLAFGFSRYDGAGRYLGEVDGAGKPLPLDGWVPVGAQADSPHYGSVVEYMQILAAQETVQDCMTEHFLSFATARTTDAIAKAQAPEIGAQYREHGSTLTAMVSAVAQSPLFRRTVVVNDATGDTP